MIAAAVAETTSVGEPLLNIGIFAAFVAITLVVVLRASRNNKTAADYYAAGRSFTGFPGHFRDGVADVDPVWVEPLEEREPGDNDCDAEHRTAPSAGVLDRIDLRLASIAGHAIRYRHGRAWFEPSGQSRIAP